MYLIINKGWFLFTDAILYLCWCCHLAKEELKSNRIQRRVHELLSKAARSKPKHIGLNQRELRFVFFRKPNDFQESKERAGHVSGMHFEKTVLQGNFLFVQIFILKLELYNIGDNVIYKVLNCHNFLYKCKYVQYWAFLKCLIQAIFEALLYSSTFKSIVVYCAMDYLWWLIQLIIAGVSQGKQIAIGTGEFEDIKCGYHLIYNY